MKRYIILLTIVLCVLGCSDKGQAPINEQEKTVATVRYIEAIAGVRSTLYLAAAWDGLFRFNTRSLSWEPILSPSDIAYSLAVDDTTLYVGTHSGIYRQKIDGGDFARITHYDQGVNQSVEALAVNGNTITTIRRGRLLRSTDGGNVWHQIDTSEDNYQTIIHPIIRSLAVNGDTIYIFTTSLDFYNLRVLGSVDGGLKWTAINGLPNKGIPDLNPPLIISQNTLYIGTSRGIYRLIVGTTKAIPTGLYDRNVTSLVASPTTLYAGTWKGGVFRSDDGGNLWKNIGLEGVYISTLAFFENRLYVGTWFDGLFYTDDEGETWHPLNKGLNHLIY